MSEKEIDGTTTEEVEQQIDRANEAWDKADSAIEEADRRGEDEQTQQPTETGDTQTQ